MSQCADDYPAVYTNSSSYSGGIDDEHYNDQRTGAGKVALITGGARGIRGITKSAAYELASDESSYSTGLEFVVDGGITAGVRFA